MVSMMLELEIKRLYLDAKEHSRGMFSKIAEVSAEQDYIDIFGQIGLVNLGRGRKFPISKPPLP